MQHLRDLYSGEWLKTCTVEYFREVKDRSSKHQDNWNYSDFVNFPKQHGFEIKDGYILYSSAFSEDCCCRMRPQEFQQEWLFFQLISCVVQESHGPILAREELICHGHQLNTGNLNRALTRWHKYLEKCHDEDPEATTMKFLEANQILELAKQVVIANLADKPNRLFVPQAKGVRHDPDEEKDEQALCYMILGETLSAVLVHAMKKCNVKLPGWEPDDEGGWGPLAHVYKKMQKGGWCPRSQATIKGQLGRNATLLYVTTCAHESNRHNIHGDQFPQQRCNSRECGFIEAEYNEAGVHQKYELSHSANCPSPKECRLVGPDEEDILDILESSEDQRKGPFPLMRIVEREGKKGIKVEQWTERTPFATISHVWSQGLGNRTERKIHACQLEMIETWVKTAFGDEDYKGHLFWIDTFAIPQNKGKEERRARLKQRAIGLIHHIFSKAKHCIIIDRHLLATSKSIHDCRTIGATLLACGWMMRLWTLQEAFTETASKSFNDLWRFTGEEDVVLLSMAGMVQRKVDHNLMVRRKADHDPTESEREAPQQPITHGRHHTRGALLMASAWRATRYRTTRNLREETLALATLLGVPISQDPTESAGRAPNGLTESNGLPATNGSSRPEASRGRKLEELMKDFWESICREDDLRNSIPPGMIFLPGKRLPFPGFGWAPLTWMSGEDEAYPYPLGTPEHPTTLKEDRGLVVKYPGFLLYPTRRKLGKIITVSKPFEFSVNRGLDEWYRVKAANQKIQQNDDSLGAEGETEEDVRLIAQDLRSRMENNEAVKIAIILSRPRPVEVTGEIGLLVELCPEDAYGSRGEPSPSEQKFLYCRIIRRVEVSRLSVGRVENCLCDEEESMTPGYGPIVSRFDKFEQEGIAGVQLHDLQEWCVDGYHHQQTPKSSMPPSPKPEDTASPPDHDGLFGRLKRAMTWSLPQMGEA
ncbi:hypothetical protein CEP52_008894 [Fusarium oligoseptatum]|uniref:Heterokaryon incompatibility domain-containing protein n=1 Tax=Fusarium oligoseptatum TaxID=2604345 RepID=A0A428TFJ3_9HYPO|nr:hypothetical protein CEP52_008894 [Fusarium oligoseptatum]